MSLNVRASMVLLSLLYGFVGMDAARASEISRSLDVDPDGEIEVRNLAGSVHVSGWDRPELALQARLAPGQELDLQQRTGRVVIDVDHARQRRPDAARIELRVPHGSRLRLTAVSADLEVYAVHGELNLQTVSGAIIVREFGADVRARTVTGEMDLEGRAETGRIALNTVQGRVRLAEAAGVLELSTVNGPVQIEGGRFERVRFSGVNGALRGKLELGDRGRLEADSIAGAVVLELPTDLPARFDLESFSGRIEPCDGVAAQREGRHGPGTRLSHVRGEGSALVRVKTMSGAIDVCE